jgi:hypothetical protein
LINRARRSACGRRLERRRLREKAFVHDGGAATPRLAASAAAK